MRGHASPTRRSRTRRRATFACIALAALLWAMIPLSFLFRAEWRAHNNNLFGYRASLRIFAVTSGRLEIAIVDRWPPGTWVERELIIERRTRPRLVRQGDEWTDRWSAIRPRRWGDQVFVPLWTIALPASAPAFVLWRRLRQLLRCERGHCTACNYNLASLPPGTRCPECGAASACAEKS